MPLFSHGFVTFKANIGNSSGNIDVIMAAPKGSGASVRTNFLAEQVLIQVTLCSGLYRRGIGYTLALSIAIGSGFNVSYNF